MGQTDGMDGHFWGVEAISQKITAENLILRQMSDFGPILDEEVAFSRTSTSNHENHLHHDPPMDPTERFNRHIWGVEAISHKITAENLIFCRFSLFDALGGGFRAILRQSIWILVQLCSTTLPWDHRRLMRRVVSVRHAVWGVREGWVGRKRSGCRRSVASGWCRLWSRFCALFGTRNSEKREQSPLNLALAWQHVM